MNEIFKWFSLCIFISHPSFLIFHFCTYLQCFILLNISQDELLFAITYLLLRTNFKKQIKNFYTLRSAIQKAKPLDGFFVSAEGCAITNITGQIVYPTWRDNAGTEDNFGGPVMRHTMCTWSSDMMTPEGQALVAKAMEHSKKTAEKTYTHSHRAEVEEYLRITKHMFNNMDEFIDPDDMAEAQAEWDAYNLEEQEQDTGAIVLNNMRTLLQTRELRDDVRDSEDDDAEDGNDSDLFITSNQFP